MTNHAYKVLIHTVDDEWAESDETVEHPVGKGC